MKKNLKKPQIILALVFTLSVALMVWALPREKQFSYKYEQGRPWNYGALMADFDFTVNKNEVWYKAELDSAKAAIGQYYVVSDSLAGKHQAQLYREEAKKSIYCFVNSKFKNKVGSMIQQFNQDGIVSLDQMKRLKEGGFKRIVIVRGGKEEKRSVDQLHTTQSAYEQLLALDTMSASRAFLTDIGANRFLESNLVYDKDRTEREEQVVAKKVSPVQESVMAGQKIIDRGEIVDAKLLTTLNAYKAESEKRTGSSNDYLFMLLGQIGAVLIIIGLMVVYLSLYRKDVLISTNKLCMLFALTTIFPVVTGFMLSHHFLSVYLLPYAMAPILTRVFIDSRTATMQLIVVLLISSLTLKNPYVFIASELIAGMVAIYALREIHARSQIFRTALIVTGAEVLSGLLVEFVQGHSFSTVNYHDFLYILGSGVLLLFTYPLMYLVERVFSFTSDVTLIELTNINHPLLRRMSKEAQGTFIHSMQVANLAAEVANKIGGNSQLVRTGALYHDIGKMKSPAFFTENQSGQNPHDQLNEEESAAIIISHVTEGLRLAEKHGLPKVIKDFILTHHGCSRVGYFYIQACNKRGQENVDPADFTYPGRSPFTLEQAILMMTDAVEAASRSLKEYTEENIQNLVDKIIDGQLAAGHFKYCPINFRDIALAKEVFCDSLKTIYHTRIAYPEKKK